MTTKCRRNPAPSGLATTGRLDAVPAFAIWPNVIPARFQFQPGFDGNNCINGPILAFSLAELTAPSDDIMLGLTSLSIRGRRRSHFEVPPVSFLQSVCNSVANPTERAPRPDQFG